MENKIEKTMNSIDFLSLDFNKIEGLTTEEIKRLEIEQQIQEAEDIGI